tara:strand:- start:1061 stop:1918 length:858 start_codon:yes stop_codon:yes gene_type:complete
MSYTYTTLKQAIKDYTDNDETTFVKNLPIFIRNTEERILKNVQLNLFQKNASGGLTGSNKYLNVPDDFLAPFSLSYITSDNDHVFLDFKDADFVQTFTPRATTTGNPRYYAQYDQQNFIIAPTPSSSFDVELHYFYRPTSITQSTFTLTTTASSGTFTTSDTVTGSTSGESGGVSSVNSSTSLLVVIPSGDFVVGETITGDVTGATAEITAIGADTTVTWFGKNAEIAMLYGALMEAYIFMKGEQDMEALYEKRFSEAMVGLKSLGESKEVTDEYRTGPVVRPKQ